MNSREHLNDKLTTATARSKQVNYVAWGVAVFVMIYGTPIVFDLATAHGIPGGVAWMLSLAADASLCVGLIATPVLASLSVAAGWVGTLRWVSGLITWALQTGSSWTHPGGVDGVGVAVHTAGPLLLFFAVEAASYFHRKVSAALTDLRRELAQAEQTDADVRAERAEIDAQLRSTTAELTAARAEITALTERLTAATAHAESERDTAALNARRLDAENAALRTQLTEQAEKAAADKAQALREQKEKLTDRFSKDRAENPTVLSDYRDGRTAKTPSLPSNRPAMSDEAAVQAMLAAHDDPDFEWSKNAVRTLTGAGFGRIPGLIDLWLTAASDKARGEPSGKAHGEPSGDQAVNE